MKTQQLLYFLSAIASDKRVNVWHIGTYYALIQLWLQSDQQNTFQISRRKVMALARIGSIVTYHKCIKELQLFGYIIYTPSYNPFLGSKVCLINELN